MIKRLRPGDGHEARDMARLMDKAFGNAASPLPDLAHYEDLLCREEFWAMAAYGRDAQGKACLAGGLTAHVLPSFYTDEPELMIYDLGVDANWRGKGIGRALVEKAQEAAMEIGAEMFVDAHEDNPAAMSLYKSTGGREESVCQFTYPIKP